MVQEATLRPTDVVELNPVFVLRWEQPQQAYVLLYPEGLVKLNSTAAEILTIVADNAAVGDVVERLTETYNDQDIAAEILEALETFHDNGWIRIKR